MDKYFVVFTDDSDAESCSIFYSTYVKAKDESEAMSKFQKTESYNDGVEYGIQEIEVVE